MADDALEISRNKIYNSISDHAESIMDRTKNIVIRAGYTGMCFHCQNAMIFRAKRDNDPTIVCFESPTAFQHKPLDIEECNKFAKKGELDIWSLIKTSEIVDLSKPTAKAGFDLPNKEDDGISK